MATETEDKTTANWMKEAQKGYIRMGVLILLNKKPSHGYEIMKEINSRTKGFWQPTAGGVYPILRDLRKIRIHQRPMANAKKPKTKSLQNHRIRRTNPQTSNRKTNRNFQTTSVTFSVNSPETFSTLKRKLFPCRTCLRLSRLSLRRK